MGKLLVCAVFFLTIAYIVVALQESEPTECYHCSLINGELCNKPELDKISKQSCKNIPTHKNTTSKVVCYTVTATWVGRPITERGCYYQEMEHEDLCAYFKRTEANAPFTKDYACKLCYTDLCNGLPR